MMVNILYLTVEQGFEPRGDQGPQLGAWNYVVDAAGV